MARPVFVIGATGKVGRELVGQLFEKPPETAVVGVASSRSLLYDELGLSADAAKGFASGHVKGDQYEGMQGLVELLRGIGRPISIVDVTASTEILGLHKEVILKMEQHGIVTANKNPLAYSTFDDFVILTGDAQRYGYRSTVMAGAPAVPELRELRRLGYTATMIVGSFSGSLGFLAYEIEHGRSFSGALKEAMDLGYIEPDPAIDLSGEDVAKKILILARTAGFRFERGDIHLTPFIPEKFLSRNLSDPSHGLEDLDEHMQRMADQARTIGNKLRYVARFADVRYERNAGGIYVNPEFVDQNSNIGRLSGTANIMVITVPGMYGFESTYSIEAPGAGPLITAANIRRDLLDQGTQG